MKALLRLTSSALILFAVFTTTRALIRLLPGDPIDAIIAETGNLSNSDALRADLGLDRPFIPALMIDTRRALHGDFGKSLLSREAVGPLLLTRFCNSLKLALAAFFISLPLSIVLGVKAASHPGGLIDRCCSVFGALSSAIPTLCLGPMLMIVLSIWIPVFQASGDLFLPALTLSTGYTGIWARLIRVRVRETLKHGSANSARARGLPEWKVLLKYGFAPASSALVAYLGTQFGSLLAGSFVCEWIFNWHGMGMLFVQAVQRRDYPIVEGAAFVASSACLLGTWMGDWFEGWIDPRRSVLDVQNPHGRTKS